METSKTSEDLLLRLLSAAELRSRVISANIANQNTPGYTRREVSFEESLRAAIQTGSDVGGLQPVVFKDTVTEARPDGNNVNLELELNAMRENRLLFETYAAVLEGRSALRRIAVTEGR